MSKLQQPATILIVDDMPQRAQTCQQLLEQAGYQTRRLMSLGQLPQVLETGTPSCALVSERLLGWAKSDHESAAMIVISGHVIWKVARALQNGGIRRLPGDAAPLELLLQVAASVESDQWYHHRRVADSRIRSLLATLSDGERQVLDLLAEGNANKVIARELRVTMRTVERRRRRILEKLHAESLAQLVQMVALSSPRRDVG